MERIRSQDAAAMQEALNAIPLAQGDTILVAGSTVHAFDAGVLMAEVEEPTDIAFLFEYADFGVSEERATLGLSWDQVLDASNLRATTEDQLGELVGHVDIAANRDTLVRSTPACADSFFVGWVASVGDRLEGLPSLAIAIVVSGEGEARCPHATTLFSAGDTFVVPFACSPWSLHGSAIVALYEPPLSRPGSVEARN
jgi:mannose-6-phosphate isomerase class I